MERLALVPSHNRPRRARPWHGWRPGPTEPYPLFPAERRLEWLAFVATPIGGIMAVVSSGAAGAIAVWLFLPAVFVGFLWSLRELSYRLPLPALRIFEGLVRAGVLLVVASLFLLIVWALWKDHQ